MSVLLALVLLQFCNAQTKDKNEVKFKPPVLKKDKPSSMGMKK